MSKKPSVVIVGRMNVGKSTLFNRLSVAVKSLTLDYAGVTRDFLKDTVSWQGKTFELIDTGGISFKKTTDPILEKTRQIALNMLQEASLIILVCDGTTGLVQEDRDIARLMHKQGKQAIVVVNKMDSKKVEHKEHEFTQLGFERIIPISAEHGRGIGDLLDVISELLPKNSVIEEEAPRCKVVFLGKPNVGKSSLMNLLLKKERSIVSDIPGTTREALSETIAFYQEDIQVTDTPGIRKKRAVTQTLETMMVKSSLRALEDADVVLLLIDAGAGQVVDQELKLAFYAFTEKHKALALIFNKQDLETDETHQQLEFGLEVYTYFLKKVPQLFISCKTEKNVGKVLPLVKTLCERYNQRFADDEITVLFKQGLAQKPLFHKSEPLLVYAARQIKTGPITIKLVVSDPRWFGPSQLTFFENLLRKNYDLMGVPVKFVVVKRTINK